MIVLSKINEVKLSLSWRVLMNMTDVLAQRGKLGYRCAHRGMAWQCEGRGLNDEPVGQSHKAVPEAITEVQSRCLSHYSEV